MALGQHWRDQLPVRHVRSGTLGVPCRWVRVFRVRLRRPEMVEHLYNFNNARRTLHPPRPSHILRPPPPPSGVITPCPQAVASCVALAVSVPRLCPSCTNSHSGVGIVRQTPLMHGLLPCPLLLSFTGEPKSPLAETSLYEPPGWPWKVPLKARRALFCLVVFYAMDLGFAQSSQRRCFMIGKQRFIRAETISWTG